MNGQNLVAKIWNFAHVLRDQGYFTPRPLIEAMVQVVDPEPHQTVHDPACGTAGFLLAAWERMKKHPKARDRGVYSAPQK